MEIKSFVRLPQGAIVAFLTEPDPELTICGMRKAISDGAEGFAIHICRLDHAYHNEGDLRKIFSYACDMPIMAINYRHADYNAGQSDEERVDELFAAIRAGASICEM